MLHIVHSVMMAIANILINLVSFVLCNLFILVFLLIVISCAHNVQLILYLILLQITVIFSLLVMQVNLVQIAHLDTISLVVHAFSVI